MSISWKTTKRDYSNVRVDDTMEDNQGESQETSGGNTGLPFGLCKKYGINVPQGATPRDAWNLLAGRGIYPPWTEKGKDQYKKGSPNDIVGRDVSKDYEKVREKLSHFPEGYRNTLEKAFSNLSDDEARLFARIIEDVPIKQGSGFFSPAGNFISTPASGSSALDRELGFDAEMTTLFHEYGHCLDRQMGKREGMFYWSSSSAVSPLYFEDCKELSQEIFKEQGVSGVLNLGRITQAQKDAIVKWAQEKTGYSKLLDQKQESDFFKPAPRKPYMYPIATGAEYKKEVVTYMRFGYNRFEAEDKVNQNNARYQEYNAKAQSEYDNAMREWTEYSKTTEYKNGLEEWNKYNSELENTRKEVAPMVQRFSFISDFFGSLSNGRIDLYSNGMYGHTPGYNSKQSNGIENWAEYCAFKLTKDSKGLELFKKYLPRTFEAYEKQYKIVESKIYDR